MAFTTLAQSTTKTYYVKAKPQQTITTATMSLQETVYTTDELIQVLRDDVRKYGGNYYQLYETIKCESNFQAYPKPGDSGLAFGVAQFHKDTFDLFTKQMGVRLDYYNPLDQLQVMVWAFNHDLAYHWSCWKRLYN